MAKDKERRVAREMYVNQGKTAKEIGDTLSVTEKTLGEWVKKYGWKEQRDAVQNSPDKLVSDLKEVIGQLTEERLKLQREKIPDENEQAAELAARKARLADEISKWTKALDSAKKENQVSLSAYIHVMEQIFQDLQKEEPKLYLKLLDFQENHIQRVASKYY